MSEEVQRVPASIDYTSFPPGLEGKWVVVRSATKTPMGIGDTLQEALDEAGISPGSDTGIVVGRIPGGGFLAL